MDLVSTMSQSNNYSPKTMESQKYGATTTHSMCTALLCFPKIVAWILFFHFKNISEKCKVATYA